MKPTRLVWGSIFLVFLFVVVGTAVVLGWSIGIGWLLTLFLPFSLFEASLLVMIASAAISALGIRLLMTVPSPEPFTDLNEPVEPAISSDRFYSPKGPVTSEAWFRFEMANDIYWDLSDTDRIINSMDDSAVKELAIRLTDVVVEMLKSRTSRSSRINVTKNQLTQQMKKMGLRPYDDDILEVAASAASACLTFDEAMADIVREKSWGEIETDL